MDDDEINRITLKEMLEIEGFEAVALEGGFEAIEEYKKLPCDLALVDLMMPDMNGIELLQKLKELNPDLPVIILTGYNEVETYLKAKELGAFEYVIKPVEFAILKQMLFQIFSSEPSS